MPTFKYDAEPRPAMLAITGGKGGCGKTTTTLGLAAALADRGLEPLVVDCDCDMPDVHHRLTLPLTSGVDALDSGASLDEVLLRPAYSSGVAVVTGGRRSALDTALRKASCWDGPVLLDCGAGTSRDALRPLRHATSAIVVSTDRPQCIEDATVTRDIARRLSGGLTGVVVRETAAESGSRTSTGQGADARLSAPRNWNLLGTLPRVEEPLTNPRAAEVFRQISLAVTDRRRPRNEQYRTRGETNQDRANRDGTSATESGENVGSTGRSRNHQRYCSRNI